MHGISPCGRSRWSSAQRLGGGRGMPGPALQSLITTSKASWSLPPFPKFRRLTTCSLPQLLKIWSTPPKLEPVKTRWIRESISLTVWVPASALKSPTRTTPSPSSTCVPMVFKRFQAVACLPQRPPVPTGNGPWWLTNSTVLPSDVCRKRAQSAPRVPHHCSGRSSATSSMPWPRSSHSEARYAMATAWSPWTAWYSASRPASLNTRSTSSHSWKPMKSYGACQPPEAINLPTLPPLPLRKFCPKRYHQNKLKDITLTSCGCPP
mmetsp:Transcript_69897/g.202578  ORF Transcript_69897/g.202578 Transcript_69897/m.202578 type:complete len:264 (+) Transcript_69897:59-850(+)